jgi:hypothetical protein
MKAVSSDAPSRVSIFQASYGGERPIRNHYSPSPSSDPSSVASAEVEAARQRRRITDHRSRPSSLVATARPLCVLACIPLLLALLSRPLALSAEPLEVDPERREVRISATIHPQAFQGWWTRLTGMPGYHLLVWDEGRSANNALFVTSASDVAFHESLVRVGARPGNALKMDTWEDRKNPESRAPERIIEGTPMDISVIWEGLDGPVRISNLLGNPGGRGFDFRFGGHLENSPIWQSGCGVCLYSCPGSKVGNAAYTVRDYVNDTTTFRAREDALPKSGTPVWIIFTLRDPDGEAH